jgi:peptidoglycan/LPS O-acetylase OafA/YrhL
MMHEHSSIRRSESLYAFFLKFYPRRYRQAFGEEMQYVFSESLKDAFNDGGGYGLIRFWSRTILDAGKSLVVQHVDNLNGADSMKNKNTNIFMQNKNILLVALATAVILLVLYVIQSADEVGWSINDFIFAGTFLFGTGLAFELIGRKARTLVHRAAIALALGTALFLFWSNLAVGIIGSEDNPANWMYLGVLAIFLLGSLMALFRPKGMVRVLIATAAAQALTVVIALVFVKDLELIEATGVNGFFIVLWLASAVLFWRTSTAQKPPA